MQNLCFYILFYVSYYISLFTRQGFGSGRNDGKVQWESLESVQRAQDIRTQKPELSLQIVSSGENGKGKYLKYLHHSIFVTQTVPLNFSEIWKILLRHLGRTPYSAVTKCVDAWNRRAVCLFVVEASDLSVIWSIPGLITSLRGKTC